MSDFADQVREIETQLRSYRERGLRVFATSSFQSSSIVLLHLLSRLDHSVPVYFLNTGYHFPETLAYKRELADRLGLDVIDLFSPVSRIQQRDRDGRLLFTSDPDHCCHLNKIVPLDRVLAEHDVWVNGIRAAQSRERGQMAKEERGRQDILRYHPLLDWTSRMVHDYLEETGLPRHPLEGQGFFSVGCQPCTRKPDSDSAFDSRTGRWFGLNKTECGLHSAPEGEK